MDLRRKRKPTLKSSRNAGGSVERNRKQKPKVYTMQLYKPAESAICSCDVLWSMVVEQA